MHVVNKNMVGGSGITRFPLDITDSERDMPGTEPGPLGWHTSSWTAKNRQEEDEAKEQEGKTELDSEKEQKRLNK